MRTLFTWVLFIIPFLSQSQSPLDTWYGDYYGGIEEFIYNESNGNLTLVMPDVDNPSSNFNYLQTDAEGKSNENFQSVQGNTFTIQNYEKGVPHYYTFSKGQISSGDPRTVVFSGIELNHDEQKGGVLVLMDSNLHPLISTTYEEYQQTLIADGWKVYLLLVSPEEKDIEVKNKIRQVYAQDPDLRSLFIIGDVARPLSGVVSAPDGHGYHTGAWIADGFYADMDYEWTDHYAVDTLNTYPIHENRIGDGRYDHTTLPSDAELEVGRLYFEHLPIFEEQPYELYQRYLEKNIRFRKSQMNFNNDYFLHWNNAAYPDRMHRNMFLLSENAHKSKRITQTANTQPDIDLGIDSYLYGSINGFGAPGGQSINGRITSANFKNDSMQVAFLSLAASNIGNWTYASQLMNATLASKSPTLITTWGVFNMPTQYLKSGETFGYCHRKGANNRAIGSGNYVAFSSNDSDEVAATLWGDPTLTMHIVQPVSDVQLDTDNESVVIDWGSPQENILGVHIYRAQGEDGDYVKISEEIVNSNTYTDLSPHNGLNRYMIRSVRLDTSASCSYFNYANGVQASVTLELVDADGDLYTSDVDCDDSDPTINPGAEEIANNNIDENCDGLIDVLDADGDGFLDDVDCDDGNPDIYPGAIEILNNGVDEDCDGEDDLPIICMDVDIATINFFDRQIDCLEGAIQATDFKVFPGQVYTLNSIDVGIEYYFDHCELYDDNKWKSKISVILFDHSTDAVISIVNQVYDCRISFALMEALNNNQSLLLITQDGDDCESLNFLANGIPSLGCTGRDQDQDGYPDYGDCNDIDEFINPGMNEIPFNFIDDDCNESTLDNDGDQDGYIVTEDCDDSDPLIFPGAGEDYDNGVDDNCNGLIDELDADGDGYNFPLDCDDANVDVNPGQIEYANNGLDNDCDGEELIIDACNTPDDAFNLQHFFLFNSDCSIAETLNTVTRKYTTYFTMSPGQKYSFSVCEGFVESTWSPRISLYQYNFFTQEIGNIIATEDACSYVFTYQHVEPFNSILIFVDDAETCDLDFIPNGNPTMQCIIEDFDNDGFFNDIDCDDTDASINPDQVEIPFNQIDDDCDPSTLDNDGDQDGYPITNDCDDTDPDINPGVIEIVGNMIDDNCNQIIDEIDADGDGFSIDVDCDDTDPLINPLAYDYPDNSIDEDCDGEDYQVTSCTNYFWGPYEDFSDVDDYCSIGVNDSGFTARALTAYSIRALVPNTDYVFSFCENFDFDVWTPLITLVQYNSDLQQTGLVIDAVTDCEIAFNFSLDSGFPDVLFIVSDADDCMATSAPSSASHYIFFCGKDEDEDGYYSYEDCNDLDPLINPMADEICDNEDNNCNGYIDEGLDTEVYYLDEDNDGFGRDSVSVEACGPPQNYVVQGGDCDDLNADINPDAVEIADNNIDEDCDGEDLMSTGVIELEERLTLYPNPVSDVLFVHWEGVPNYKTSIFTIEGIRLRSYDSPRVIKLSDLASGSYLIGLTDLNSMKRVIRKITIVE